MEIDTIATPASLAALMAGADEAASRAGLDPTASTDLRLAIEEACVNVIEHGYPVGAPGPITLTIAIHDDRLVVSIVDRARVFAPSEAPPSDLTADWRQRRIGGLGWYLIHRIMDSVEHEAPPEGGNRLTLVKHI